MERYTLTVTIPLDENYDKVCQYLKSTSYQKTFWHSFAPPHKIEYVLGPLSETGVLNVKETFRDIFKDSKFKSSCNFTTVIYKDDI